MKILLVIPSFNHNKYLVKLLESIKKVYNDKILCIDDGSTIPIKLNDNNVVLIKNDINMGKGYSIIKGAEYAAKNSYTHIIVIDSDLQHNPENIIDFINADSKYDLVYGRRSFFKTMPLHRILSNLLTSFIISLLSRKKILDSQCGFRRYSLKLFNKKYDEKGYQFESEILLRGLNANSLIKKINIPTIYNDNKSNMNIFSDTLKFIKMIIRNIS